MKQKWVLAGLIATLWLVVYLTGKIMPFVSSVVLLVVFVAAYTWLLTLAMVDQKRREWKKPPVRDMDYLPRVSVIIAAHNEQMVIEHTVREMLKLDYPDFELLVMDDRSTDRTPEIMHALIAELNDSRLRYHQRDQDAFPGKPAAMNEALTVTNGEILCVFDADATTAPDFLRAIMPFLADDNVGAVQARKVIINEGENWLTRCQNYEYSLDSHFQYGRDSVQGAVELRGNGQLVKREALVETGGWNNLTLTDDLDLSTRLHLEGWDIRFAHKVCVFEEGITQFKALLKQRRRWTEGTLWRYLEYAGKLLTCTKVSFRTRMDLVAYFLEFLLPIWLALDLIMLAWGFVVGDPTPMRIMSSLFVIPVFCYCMSLALTVAIIRFNRPPIKDAVLWAIITGVYMTAIWFPLVFGIAIKVLVQKERRLRWDKTEHSGHSNRPPAMAVSEPTL